jgi:PAS domain S-box-containing protein
VAFAWQHELEIGATVVDADHRALAELLARAQDVYAKGDARAAVKLLRLFLAKFTRHFEDETGFLGRRGCGDMAARRSEYWTAHAIFSAHSLEADDVEIIGQMIAFAEAWLIDHIVRQDTPQRAHFLDGRTESRHSGWRLGFDVIKLRWRIALLALVPLVVLAGVAVATFTVLNETLDSMRRLSAMNRLNDEISAVVHELQRERSLCTMFLGDRRLGPGLLDEQFARTNAAVVGFHLAAKDLDNDIRLGEAQERLRSAHASLDLIAEVRHDLLTGSYNAIETMDSYGLAIEDLTAVVPEVMRSILPSDFTKLTLAQSYLIQAKERAGRERAAGINALSGGAPDRTLKPVHLLASEQEALAEGFMALAPIDLANAFAAADREAHEPLNAMRRALETEDSVTLSVQEWYDVTSARIDAMRAVEVELTRRLNTAVAKLGEKTQERVLFFGGGLAVMVLVSLAMVGGLAWTVLPQLGRLGEAIRQLAGGTRLVTIPGLAARDELGDIARTLQQLKERLVHGDLLEARRLTANVERLRVVADNVPGVVFRVLEPDGRPPVVACVSRKLRDITGLSPTEVIDRPVRSVLRRLLSSSDWLGLLHALSRTPHRAVDFEFKLRDGLGGQMRWMCVLASPSKTEGGWVWDGVALDVTALKTAQEERTRIAAELDRIRGAQMASEVRSEMSAMISPLEDHAAKAARLLPAGSPERAEVEAVLAGLRRLRGADAAEQTPPARPVSLAGMVRRNTERLAALLPPGTALRTTLAAEEALVLGEEDEVAAILLDFCAVAAGNLAGQPALELAVDMVTLGHDGQYVRLCVGGDGGFDLPEAPQVTDEALTGDPALGESVHTVERLGGWTVLSGAGRFEIYLPVHEVRSGNIIQFRGGA